MAFLAHCREGAMAAAGWFGWQHIHCAENGEPRTVEDIHSEILALVQDVLKKEK